MSSSWFPKFYLISFVLCVLIFSACQGRISKKVNSMMHERVRPDTSYMKIITPHVSIYNSTKSDKAYLLVVYNDETECLSCRATKLNVWHKFLTQVYNDYHGVEVCFIFSPKCENTQYICKLLENQRFGHSVYIDTANVFRKSNPWIPNESIYHTFLLDKDDKIVLVGNPHKNIRISQMFFDMLEKQHN